MSKRVLIMTGASDILRQNQIPNWGEDGVSYYDVLDATNPSKIKYAKKHNYDFLCMRSFGSAPELQIKETEIGFLRTLAAFENLNKYDVVMWVDADAIITNQEMSIDKFPLEEDVTFYASYDWMGKGSFSTGNFIIQKTKHLSQFFHLFINIYKQINSHEQDALNAMYYQTNANSTIKILECEYLNSFHEEIINTPTWSSGRNPISPHCFWKEGCFLSHLGGITNSERLNMLNSFYKEYL